MKEKFAHLSFLEMTLNLRDSRLATGTDLLVLYTLNSRVRPSERYSCFPPLDSIAADAGVNIKTVKRSIDRLIKANLVQKVQRFDTSSVYFLNVALMQEEADKNRGLAAEEKEEEGCAFALPRVAAKAPNTLPVDTEPTPDKLEPVYNKKPIEEEPVSCMDEIIALLKSNFPEHATFALPNCTSVIKPPLQACIDMAGSAGECLNVLTTLCADDSFTEAKGRVAKSNSLGGYLRKCFPDLMEKAKETSKPLDLRMNEAIQELISNVSADEFGLTFTAARIHMIPAAIAWLSDNLGTHMTDWVEFDTDDPKEPKGLNFKISQEYQAATILFLHTGKTLVAEDLAVREDLEVGVVARWAVADETWSTRLKEAPDVSDYFMDSLEAIIRDRQAQTDDDGVTDDDDAVDSIG